jgi:hypothetical protein
MASLYFLFWFCVSVVVACRGLEQQNYQGAVLFVILAIITFTASMFARKGVRP